MLERKRIKDTQWQKQSEIPSFFPPQKLFKYANNEYKIKKIQIENKSGKKKNGAYAKYVIDVDTVSHNKFIMLTLDSCVVVADFFIRIFFVVGFIIPYII